MTGFYGRHGSIVLFFHIPTPPPARDHTVPPVTLEQIQGMAKCIRGLEAKTTELAATLEPFSAAALPPGLKLTSPPGVTGYQVRCGGAENDCASCCN